MWGVMLGIEWPWQVLSVELEIGGRIPGRRPTGRSMYLIGTVRVSVQHSSSGKMRCPVCGASCVRHDHRARRWRYLDTMQFAMLVTALVPRAICVDETSFRRGRRE